MKVLFAASECVPFVASGGLADVIGSLPAAIAEKGCECRVVIPLYSAIPSEYRENMSFLTNVTVDVAWRKQYCGIFTSVYDGITYYFIDNEYYFKRDGIYGHPDDGERFVFFSRAVLEIIRIIDFKPDIIHANDWQTALISVYYQIFYKYQEEYENIKNIFTIHNIQYQGKFGKETLTDLLGVPMYHIGLLEYDGYINLVKAALETADYITTVSPTYAVEILDSRFSYGLDKMLLSKNYKLKGVLNGLDIVANDPATDSKIPDKYTIDSLAGKKRCKEDLLALMDLPDDNGPVIGIVSRLVAHKGIELIKQVFESILDYGFKFIILGSGESIYENFFKEMAWRYPDKVAVTLEFNPTLSKQIFAGADMFLMPSQNEPCGLTQMMAMRYGTIPIVRKTGGLADTVNEDDNTGNGFTFRTFSGNEMLAALKRAKTAYDDAEKWTKLIKRAMEEDWSWNKSACEYITLYESL